MNTKRDDSIEMSSNTFGKLVRTYREERGWTQEELAERWGYTRAYVSQIEHGKRTLNHVDQVGRLADILEIPTERLEAIGRGLTYSRATPESPADADDFLLQTLLEPAQATVKLSWLVWHANHDTTIIQNLTQLISQLETAVTERRGKFLKPAQQILGYAHEMMGNIAFDQLDYMTAGGHFQEMFDWGEVLNDPDMTALAMIHQGDILRRRGRFEHAVSALEKAAKYADTGSLATSGLRWAVLARTYAEFGHKEEFLKAIDAAQDAAVNVTPSLNTTSIDFNLVDIIQERAQGHTLLGEPKVALELYQESERLKPFRPMRDLGVFIILQAQAHAYAGDVEGGVNFALQGLRLARGYQSKRHESRVQRMYDRLRVTPMGNHPSMRDLQQALHQH